MNRIVLSLTVAALGGCAARFEAFDYDTITPRVVRVDLDTKGPGWFGLIVKNIGDQPITMSRDRVTLHTARGTRAPLASSMEDAIVVAPGGTKAVKMRYETKDLPMYSMVALHFDHAFRVGSADADSPFPMNFRVGERGPWDHPGPFDCCIHEPVAR